MPQSHPVIGWREWVSLPDLAIAAVQAKIDTGARTASLHALSIEEYTHRGAPWVRFQVQPLQQDRETVIGANAPLLEYRHIRSSNGQVDHRAVISTTIALFGRHWPIEVTLSDRKEMGFRLLLGRKALGSRFMVDPGRSFVSGRQPQTDHERHLARLRERRLAAALD